MNANDDTATTGTNIIIFFPLFTPKSSNFIVFWESIGS
jgi:hypothetical protein